MQKNETGPLSHTINKNLLKMTEDLNIRPGTIKLLEENMGNKLLDIGLQDEFLKTDTKNKATKQKLSKWDYIQLKCFFTAKEPITKMKWQPI